MRVSELIALLQTMPQHEQVILQTRNDTGFNTPQTVINDCGIVYLRTFTLEIKRIPVVLNGQQYEVTRTSCMSEGRVVSWEVSQINQHA